MSGPHRMEEFKFFRGGATLVISIDGINLFSKRRCSNKGLKKRDEELQLWLSSGQMFQVDEEPKPITRFCIRDQKQNSTFYLENNIDGRSSSTKQSPSLSVSSRDCRLLQEPIQQSTFTDLSNDTTELRLNLNIRDIFSLITKDLNMVTIDQCQSFVVFRHENIPPQLFSDISYTQDRRTFTGNTICHINDNHNVSSDLKNVTAYSPCDPNNNNNDSEGCQSEMVMQDYFHMGKLPSLLKSCQKLHNVGLSPRGDRNEKMRKSVSFDDDVRVYLFDQESPTVELHSEPCTSVPNSYSCPLPDVTLEDNGLEWEDDFSALEKNCHFQCVRHSKDYTFSLPTQRWMSLPRPERFSLSQSCLFLTHIAESDLEL
ncbi:uncharacterized protein [Channa argus]|uniref:uncharacterized protein n=1 Tax=Channa argus TaxID=215402 RepID=UPI003520F578